MSNEPVPIGDPSKLAPSGSAPKLPPHPLDGEWHLHTDGQTYGPFSGHKLREFAREGRLSAGTDVVRVGSDTWTKASDDPTLSSLFAATVPFQRITNIDAGKVSAAPGATVVQVTNNISPQQPTILIDGGVAKPKSAGLALFLSLLIVGLGQIYNGEVAKGILMFIGCIILWIGLLGWIINLWSIIDAYITARNINTRYQQRLAAGVIL